MNEKINLHIILDVVEMNEKIHLHIILDVVETDSYILVCGVEL
jgi:hypothetical protein